VHARPKARVPIVALKDSITGLKCDICMCNQLAVLNSRLLRCYMQLDPRAKPLAFCVKHWAKRRSVNDPYHGSPSSYAWVLLVIHYLQTTSPPILPVLQDLFSHAVPYADAGLVRTPDGREFDCYFYDDVERLRAAMGAPLLAFACLASPRLALPSLPSLAVPYDPPDRR
jgi:terminal uridylyltransferase